MSTPEEEKNDSRNEIEQNEHTCKIIGEGYYWTIEFQLTGTIEIPSGYTPGDAWYFAQELLMDLNDESIGLKISSENIHLVSIADDEGEQYSVED